MAIYNSWDDIYLIEDMQILSTENTSQTIFSNGYNNCEVMVRIRALALDGSLLTGIPMVDIQAHCKLVIYQTGIELTYRTYEPTGWETYWFYNSMGNQWTVNPSIAVLAKSYESSAGDADNSYGNNQGSNACFTEAGYPCIYDTACCEQQPRLLAINNAAWSQAPFYIRRGFRGNEATADIAFTLNLTHPAAPIPFYSTAALGNDGFQSFTRVNAIRAIDYSNPDNVVIPNVGDVPNYILSDRIGWVARVGAIYYTHTTGRAEVGFIELRPRIGGYFTEAWMVARRFYNNNAISTAQTSWGGGQENVFSAVVNNTYDSINLPMSVIGRGGTNYQVNFFYHEAFDITVDGAVFSTNGNLFRFSPYATVIPADFPYTHPAVIVRLKFTMYEQGAWNYSWSSTANDRLVIFLQDRYGNFGEFNFTLNEDNFFDIPGAV